MNRFDFNRLELTCQAMWIIMKEKLNLTDEDLVACIAELDLSDGIADGKKAKAILTCPNCKRANSRSLEFCMYCGQILRSSPFD